MKTKIRVAALLCAAALFVVVAAGCASTPKAFETAESLAETQWGMAGSDDDVDLFEFHDAASGVYTNADGKEISFTYTASYDAKKRVFTGQITPAEGAPWDFTAKKELFGWDLYPELENKINRQNLTPEQIKNKKDNKRELLRFTEQYGKAYNPGNLDMITLKRSDGKTIIFAGNTLSPPTSGGTSSGQKSGGVSVNVNLSGEHPYRLHSKDGDTISLAQVNALTGRTRTLVGTFRINVSGDGVTISGGAGEGAQFNGVWKKE